MDLLERIYIVFDKDKRVLVDKGIILYDFMKKFIKLEKDNPVMLAKINKNYFELTSPIEEEGLIETVSLNDDVGYRTYIRTLQFILIKAVFDIYPEAKVTIEHSISKGLYGEIQMGSQLTEEDITKIKKRMNEIVSEDIKINKIYMKSTEAEDIFRRYSMQDKIDILKYINAENVYLYELGGRYDSFYGYMGYSTGVVRTFDIMIHDSGFVLRYPLGPNFNILPDFVENKKLDKIFIETEEWSKILDVDHVGSLNNKVMDDEITDIVRISEALHEKKLQISQI